MYMSHPKYSTGGGEHPVNTTASACPRKKFGVIDPLPTHMESPFCLFRYEHSWWRKTSSAPNSYRRYEPSVFVAPEFASPADGSTITSARPVATRANFEGTRASSTAAIQSLSGAPELSYVSHQAWVRGSGASPRTRTARANTSTTAPPNIRGKQTRTGIVEE